MKRIAVIMGSPRKNGNTDRMVERFAKGAESAGNQVDVISLVGKKVAGCLGCNACKKNNGIICCQHDDMDDIYPRLAAADVIVAATPLYGWTASSQLKAVLDRLYTPYRNTFKVRKAALISVCAGTSEHLFDALKMEYSFWLDCFGLEDGGIATARGIREIGEIEGNPGLEAAEELGRTI